MSARRIRNKIFRGLKIAKRTIAGPRPESATRLDRTLLSKKPTVFATTVIRGSTDRDLTGYLLKIDWRGGEVQKKAPIPIESGHPFWNPRGGNRGGRGLCVHKGVIYVATALSILKFDLDLHQIGEITHPKLAGLHEILVDETGIWCTSTVHDLIVKLDRKGRLLDEWYGSESSILQSYFGYDGRDLNIKMRFPNDTFEDHYEEYCSEERLHLNSIYKKGRCVYTLGSKVGSFIRIRPTPEQIVIHDPILESPHNGRLTEDGKIVLNDTGRQSIRTYSRKSGKVTKIINTKIADANGSTNQFAKPGWQRGLTHVERSIYLVGTSPATIFEVDIADGHIGKVVNIDSRNIHCIHGIDYLHCNE